MNPIPIALSMLATWPRPAQASGFYLPWWGEALLFLLLTPAGWACTTLLAAVLVAVVVVALWRRKGRP